MYSVVFDFAAIVDFILSQTSFNQIRFAASKTMNQILEAICIFRHWLRIAYNSALIHVFRNFESAGIEIMTDIQSESSTTPRVIWGTLM